MGNPRAGLHAIAAIVMAAAVAGCEGESPDGDTSGAPETQPAETRAAPEPEPARETAGEVALRVVETPQHGMHLADADGRALYLLKADAENASSCHDACAEAWPPFLASDGNPPAMGPAVQESLIGTVKRQLGAMQVTYNGHPLYYYAKDREPGDAHGQDVTDEWGEWYLVTPEGDALEKPDSGTDL